MTTLILTIIGILLAAVCTVAASVGLLARKLGPRMRGWSQVLPRLVCVIARRIHAKASVLKTTAAIVLAALRIVSRRAPPSLPG